MTASADRLLRRTLWGNSMFSLVSGVLLAAFATPFAAAAARAPLTVVGLDFATVLELLGVGVVIFGALCAWIASRNPLPGAWARAIFAADLAWVVGSVSVLLLPASWTTAGVVGIAILAVIVADLAILEYLGLRRLDSAN
ncbi:MAG: hypothetical protein ACHQK9_09705 [Reyranellales bacterium]